MSINLTANRVYPSDNGSATDSPDHFKYSTVIEIDKCCDLNQNYKIINNNILKKKILL